MVLTSASAISACRLRGPRSVSNRARIRSLWPREHGAYVQLLAPLATALAANAPDIAAAAIAIAAGLAFLASEPLRVLVGDRGARQRELAGCAARRRLAWLGGSALLVGGAGLALAPLAALAATCVLAVPIALVFALSSRRAVHTLAGELVVAAVLSGVSVPVAIAAGTTSGRAVLIWCAWSAGYAATVIAVHHVLAGHRHRASISLSPRLAMLGALCVLTIALGLHDPVGWLAMSLLLPAALIVIWCPSATRLRALGIMFLVSSIAAMTYAVLATRAS
jgi:hypothetical protein